MSGWYASGSACFGGVMRAAVAVCTSVALALPIGSACASEPGSAAVREKGDSRRIPKGFRGEWDPVTDICRPAGVLTIEAKWLRFAYDWDLSFEARVLKVERDQVDMASPSTAGQSSGFWRIRRIFLKRGFLIRLSHFEKGFEGDSDIACNYVRRNAQRGARAGQG